MSNKLLVGLAVLTCSTLAAPCRAGDATVANVTVTHLMGTLYRVDMSGTLSLANTGVIAPTLQVNGSYTASVSVFRNALDPNWTATATITWYKNAQMQTGTKEGTKAFTIP